jgi:HIV Tat-specific factor 1
MNKKRKEPEDFTSNTLGSIAEAGPTIKRGKKSGGTDKSSGERKSKNTAVYITGLPEDTTGDELADCFRKFGLLEEDDDGAPKVKMYARDDGTFSGEALVVYFKEDSVSLACTMLDDAELRLGDPSSRMRVTKADFTHKNSGGAPGVSEDKPRKTIDKKRATKRIVNMQKCVAAIHLLSKQFHGLLFQKIGGLG